MYSIKPSLKVYISNHTALIFLIYYYIAYVMVRRKWRIDITEGCWSQTPCVQYSMRSERSIWSIYSSLERGVCNTSKCSRPLVITGHFNNHSIIRFSCSFRRVVIVLRQPLPSVKEYAIPNQMYVSIDTRTAGVKSWEVCYYTRWFWNSANVDANLGTHLPTIDPDVVWASCPSVCVLFTAWPQLTMACCATD